MLLSVNIIYLLLRVESLLTLLKHFWAVLTEAGEAFDNVVEIGDGSLFLELLYFSPVGLRNVLGTGELIVALWKLKLAQEASLLKFSFL
jgi:hypothetical protein